MKAFTYERAATPPQAARAVLVTPGATFHSWRHKPA